ncbi:PIN domain-containing protein [Galbibacter sp. EGI 63066]|uniref:PIN domain-containing protein n=1 Tax=Galbibacter sp. EGI 63066 TaxID=2993559 RepID=UPI0022491EAF|nr:PIN domain-containing protein [Galbibacter sp. EGI 63066]MCX2681071.1 PIN domain-containing protein [Galbibacter sp. EGI 63066]
MIHSVRFTCVLDTNVIYPIDIRDLLFWFAVYELFTPKWSKHIFDEWESVMKRKGVPDAEIKKRIKMANDAFPDAFVNNYEGLIDGLTLPDEKDRHVLAAAIKTNANIIVTNNLKDFPKEYIVTFGLSAKGVDDFLTDIIDLNPQKAIEAFRKLVLNRTNPDLDEFETLDRFRKLGLNDTANYLHALL